MRLSYWEQKEWFNQVDFAIIGAGFVGCFTALELRMRFPKAKILLFEKGSIPSGASTKNAGFACFGSPSELLDDLAHIPEQEVWETVDLRKKGIARLQKWFSPQEIDLNFYGGYELFSEKVNFQQAEEGLDLLNTKLLPLFDKPVFSVVDLSELPFRKLYAKGIQNPFEGQLNPAKLISALQKRLWKENIPVYFGSELKNVQTQNTHSLLDFGGVEVACQKLVICTNGFAQKMGVADVLPARAQVLITEPIPQLAWKGCFHLNQGFDYFRNVGNCILLGGGRNLDPYVETTTSDELNPKIQTYLETLLNESIHPFGEFKIAQRWTGVMGVGPSKKPIIQQLAENQFAAVRMGGMGVAIAPMVGKRLADLIYTAK